MVEEFTAKEDGAQVPQPNDGVDSGSTAALNGMSQSEVGCEAQKDGGNAEHAVLSTTATTSVSTLSLNKTSEKSLDLGMEAAPDTPKGQRSARAGSRNSQVHVGLSHRFMKDAILKPPSFPSSWTPAWFEACARSGILPEDLLEKPVESFRTPGATDSIISMRHAHYEQRRKERLDVVSAAFLEAEGSKSKPAPTSPEKTGASQQEEDPEHGDTQREPMNPEERRKLGMLRRMQEMREAAERAATAEVERKKAKQAQQLQAALAAEQVRQEKLQAMERKKQLQREKEALRQQEHARQVALAKEREAEIQVCCGGCLLLGLPSEGSMGGQEGCGRVENRCSVAIRNSL